MNNLVLHNIVLPIESNASSGQWIDALDYYPNYIRFGGKYEWGAYVSWLLKYAGEVGFQEAMALLTPPVFLDRYLKVKTA